jgi:nucleoid-associated protein YgaU
MRAIKLIHVIAIVFLVSYITVSCAHTQAESTENAQIVAPPAEGTTISVPQAENAEELPIPPQATTGTGMSAQQQAPENMPQAAGNVPEAGGPSLSPLQPAPPEMPLAPAAGEAPTMTPEALPSAPLQPAPEAVQQPSAPLLAPMAGETPTLTTEAIPAGPLQPGPEAAQQPPAPPEMPLAPAAEQAPTPATETMPAAPQPAPEAAQQPPAPPEMPLAPAAEQAPTPATETMPAAPQPAPAQETASLQPQNAPSPQAVTSTEIEKITKHPAIVPGEVLNGMPSYVNTKTTHIVKPGEDLHWLAALYYGNARLWTKIYEANKRVIKNPNRLVVGTKLVIPPK